MNSRIVVTILTGAILLAAGCEKTYEHERLDPDSERFGQVGRMIRQLREARADLDAVIARQVAGDLDEGRMAMLRAALEQIASADRARLQRVDAFGPDTYRATVKLSSGQAGRSVALLVGSGDGGMYWMGTN